MRIEQLTQEHKLKLALARSVSAARYHSLLKKFHGNVKMALKEVDGVNGTGEYGARGVIKKESLEAELADMRRQKIELVFYGEAKYPRRLMQLADAPPVLSLKGKVELLAREDAIVAIVGSRRATLAGRVFAKKLAYDLCQMGQVVVSGLASGIDREVHLGSVYHGTIAVLGCGLNIVYPMENEELYKEITKHGLLISEYGINQPVKRESFPQRNRIIAGLCWGCVVVEAKKSDGGMTGSGSLITAKYALELGRELFAVPGHPLDLEAKGCNALIKEGAILTEGVDDVMSEYYKLGGISNMLELNNMNSDRESESVNDYVERTRTDDCIGNKNITEWYNGDKCITSDEMNTDEYDEEEELKYVKYCQDKDKYNAKGKESMKGLRGGEIKTKRSSGNDGITGQTLQEKILEAVSSTGVNVNTLQTELECEIRLLRAILIEMEMNGKIYMDGKERVYKTNK